MPNTTTWVVYNLINGIFLGEAMGLAFWSNLETLDLTEACGFENELAAQGVIARLQEWGEHDVSSELFQVVPVKTAAPGLATRAECEAAGLPNWDIGTKTKRYRYRLQVSQGYVIHTSAKELTLEQLQAIAALL